MRAHTLLLTAYSTQPDEAQKELMRRTATHLFTSPNPAQLEMRILANHGRDKRFAFLRGRWSRTWKITKGRARLEMDAEKARRVQEEEKRAGLGGLAGYGDSDASDSSASEVEDEQAEAKVVASSVSEEAVKEARRARAKEWAEQRRALKAKGVCLSFTFRGKLFI